VVRTEQGDYQSVDAVIDKDLSTALLAREIRADVLVITTGVEKVCIRQAEPAGAGHRQRGADDALHGGRPFPGGQHAAQNRRLAGIFTPRRQARDYHLAGLPARGAARETGTHIVNEGR
jgi:carbamate kinase